MIILFNVLKLCQTILQIYNRLLINQMQIKAYKKLKKIFKIKSLNKMNNYLNYYNKFSKL